MTPTTRRRGSLAKRPRRLPAAPRSRSGRVALAPRRLQTTASRLSVVALACARGQLSMSCPEGTAGRLPLEQRRATLTAARRALLELPLPAQRVSPRFQRRLPPCVANRCTVHCRSHCEKKAAPHAPRTDATSARTTTPARTPCHALETSPCAQDNMGANEWANALGINDAASLETFKTKFSQLEDAAKECPVPPKDGSRCALCRRKVMLDTRFKELCNGLCSAGGSTKSTKKTINAVNSASKILEIYRSSRAIAGGRRLFEGRPEASSVCARAIETPTGASSVCRKILGDDATTRSRTSPDLAWGCRSEQCQRACPEGGFCSRRCESGEADRVATVAKMVLAGNDAKRTTSAPARRKTQTAFLGEHDGEPREATGAARGRVRRRTSPRRRRPTRRPCASSS